MSILFTSPLKFHMVRYSLSSLLLLLCGGIPKACLNHTSLIGDAFSLYLTKVEKLIRLHFWLRKDKSKSAHFNTDMSTQILQRGAPIARENM